VWLTCVICVFHCTSYDSCVEAGLEGGFIDFAVLLDDVIGRIFPFRALFHLVLFEVMN
jgi:hypothetical protein